jgi:hypothetical protein
VTIIVIPCYQGARSVGEVVRDARASGLPVVVVDDGSTDGSSAVAEAAGAAVLRHPANRGKGAALASGFAYARKIGADAVVTMDADGQHDAAQVRDLVAAHAANPSALVVGVRSFAPADMPRRSRVGNRISTFWISLYAGQRYSDTQSGFRVYPRAMFDLPLKSTKFDTETELLLRAAKMKLPLVEVPVKTIYAADHASHFHGFRDTLRVMKLVFFSPLWALVFMLASCAHAPPPAALPASKGWQTMQAEHKVTIEAAGQKRTLRGIIAVQRPDRFRLRALGPAGITLFDIVDVGGNVRVVQSIKDPNAGALAKILPSMAADLSAAYDLEPRPAGRTVDGDVIREPGRVVHETPSSIEIESSDYKVRVDVIRAETNVTLDPALWAQ